MPSGIAKSGKPRKKSDRKSSRGFPNPIDVWVGRQIRARRTVLGMSQMQLAARIGLTFQQVQKYERGVNRVAGSRLVDVAETLEVPVSWFFENIPGDVERLSPMQIRAAGEKGLTESRKIEPATRGSDPVFRRETMEFVRAFDRIKDPDVRRKLKYLIYRIGGHRPGRGTRRGEDEVSGGMETAGERAVGKETAGRRGRPRTVA